MLYDVVHIAGGVLLAHTPSKFTFLLVLIMKRYQKSFDWPASNGKPIIFGSLYTWNRPHCDSDCERGQDHSQCRHTWHNSLLSPPLGHRSPPTGTHHESYLGQARHPNMRVPEKSKIKKASKWLTTLCLKVPLVSLLTNYSVIKYQSTPHLQSLLKLCFFFLLNLPI